MVLPRARRAAVVAALRAAHPYEEPAFDVLELADLPSSRGLGRIGTLAEPEPLRAFADRVAAALPATAWGVRAAGDPDRPVRRVAVCGGAGDSALGAAAAAGVDAYVTADLRHHPARSTAAAAPPARRWSTSRTGPRSGRGAPRRPPSCAPALGGSVEVRVSTRARTPGRSGGPAVRMPVKADPAVQRRLLDLAGVDGELARLAHRRRTLPEHAALAAAETAVRTAQGRAGRGRDPRRRPGPRHPAARTRRRRRPGPHGARPEDPRRRRRGCQAGQRPAARARHPGPPAGRARGRAAGGHGAARGGRDGRRARAAGARRGRAGPARRSRERRDTALLDIDTAEAGRRREREEVVATLPADLLAEYDRRRARSGTGAALLRERRCGACRLELDRTALAALRAAPADEVVHCEECGTVLVRTAESGL